MAGTGLRLPAVDDFLPNQLSEKSQNAGLTLVPFCNPADIYKKTQSNMHPSKYTPLTLVVASNGKVRAFTTQSYTIRPFVVHLQRYSAEFEIIALMDGVTPLDAMFNNDEWVALSADTAAYICRQADGWKPIYIIGSAIPQTSHLLASFHFREALNLEYIKNATEGKYPTKRPFDGVELDQPIEDIPTVITPIPVFLPDNMSPYSPVADCLRKYDGYRLERLWNGEPVTGYVLTRSRMKKTLVTDRKTDETVNGC